MSTYSIIQKFQLEGALRLDAEYYQPEYLRLIKNLEALNAASIKDVTLISKRKFKPKNDNYFEYIDIASIDLLTGEYDKTKFLGQNAPDRAQWLVQKGDVIISTVRPNRSAISLITEDNKNLICSSGFAVLEAKNVEPEYLFIYLKTKPITNLLDRSTMATMYPAVTAEDILNLKIYLGDQDFRKNIKNGVTEALKNLGSSKLLYSQAEDLLLEELGLKDFKAEEKLSCVVNLSDVKNASRLDAEYFNSNFKNVFDATLNKNNFIELGTIFDFRRGVFVPMMYYTEQKTNRPYLRIKDLSGRIGIDRSDIIFVSDKYKSNKNDELKENDFVIAIIGDTIGKINKVSEDIVGGFCSNNTGRIRIKDEWTEKIIPEFAELLFQSIFIQSQIDKKKAQTAQPKISDQEISTILFPILLKSIQKKIADLVRRSHVARQKAKQLLDEAKRKVENLIENK